MKQKEENNAVRKLKEAKLVSITPAIVVECTHMDDSTTKVLVEGIFLTKFMKCKTPWLEPYITFHDIHGYSYATPTLVCAPTRK